jgi:hypothetical protein
VLVKQRPHTCHGYRTGVRDRSLPLRSSEHRCPMERAASTRRLGSEALVAVLPCLWLTSIRDERDPLKPVTGVREGAGQLRPYVRPAARHLPLAIMGVRVRVRRQSVRSARGTRLSAASPKAAFATALPITLFSACCRVERACARRLPCALACHAIATATGATSPFAR